MLTCKLRALLCYHDSIYVIRQKIKDKFAFPMKLDMAKFCDDEGGSGVSASAGRAGGSGGAAGGESDAEISPTAEGTGSSSSNDKEYVLYAVVIHQGGAHGGHYTALVKDLRSEGVWEEPNTAGAAPPPGVVEDDGGSSVGQGWYKMNDSSISCISAKDVEATFSGASSAYMLFYASRKHSAECGAAFKESIPDPATDATGEPAAPDTDTARQVIGRDAPTTATAAACSLPAALQAELEAKNAELVTERAAYELAVNMVDITVHYAADCTYSNNALQLHPQGRPQQQQQVDLGGATAPAGTTAAAAAAEGTAAPPSKPATPIEPTAAAASKVVSLDRRLPLARLLAQITPSGQLVESEGLHKLQFLDFADNWHIGDQIVSAATSPTEQTLQTLGIGDGSSLLFWDGGAVGCTSEAGFDPPEVVFGDDLRPVVVRTKFYGNAVADASVSTHDLVLPRAAVVADACTIAVQVAAAKATAASKYLDLDSLVVRTHFRDKTMVPVDASLASLSKNFDDVMLVLFASQEVADYFLDGPGNPSAASNTVRFHVRSSSGTGVETLVSLPNAIFEAKDGMTFGQLKSRLAEAVGLMDSAIDGSGGAAGAGGALDSVRLRVYADEQRVDPRSALHPEAARVSSSQIPHKANVYVGIEVGSAPKIGEQVFKVQFGPIALAAASTRASDSTAPPSPPTSAAIEELIVPATTSVKAFVDIAIESLKARPGAWHLETATDDIGQRNPKVDDLEATVARAKFGPKGRHTLHSNMVLLLEPGKVSPRGYANVEVCWHRPTMFGCGSSVQARVEAFAAAMATSWVSTAAARVLDKDGELESAIKAAAAAKVPSSVTAAAAAAADGAVADAVMEAKKQVLKVADTIDNVDLSHDARIVTLGNIHCPESLPQDELLWEHVATMPALQEHPELGPLVASGWLKTVRLRRVKAGQLAQLVCACPPTDTTAPKLNNKMQLCIEAVGAVPPPEPVGAMHSAAPLLADSVGDGAAINAADAADAADADKRGASQGGKSKAKDKAKGNGKGKGKGHAKNKQPILLRAARRNWQQQSYTETVRFDFMPPFNLASLASQLSTAFAIPASRLRVSKYNAQNKQPQERWQCLIPDAPKEDEKKDMDDAAMPYAGAGAGAASSAVAAGDSAGATNAANNSSAEETSKGKGKGKAKGTGRGKEKKNTGLQDLNKTLKDGGVIGVGDVADGPDDMRTAADRGDCLVWEWCRGERAFASKGGRDGKRNYKKEEGVTIFVGAFDDEEGVIVAEEVVDGKKAVVVGQTGPDDGGADAAPTAGKSAGAGSGDAEKDATQWASQLTMLGEMGFTDVGTLLPLLDKHKGDVGAVIDASMQ